MSLLATYGLLLAVTLGTAPQDPEIRELEARHWFNNPVYRLHDDRDVLLWFFTTRDRESHAIVPKLNRLQRRPDLVVIGITEDSRVDAERFIRQTRAGFTVGAGSPMLKRLDIRPSAQLYRLSRKEGGRISRVDVSNLDSLLPDWGPYGEEDISQLDEDWELVDFISSDALGQRRAEAVRKLFAYGDRAALIDLADRLLPEERNPWVRNALIYFKERAEGTREPQPEPAPSTIHYRVFSDKLDAPEWATAREYLRRVESLSVTQLLSDYRNHLTDQPNDVVIRRIIVDHLEHVQDRTAARSALLEMVAREPDYFIRLRLVGSFSTVCNVGDQEVADYLDALAETETNLLHVRPMMEYVAYVLRTGQEDTRTMQPRP